MPVTTPGDNASAPTTTSGIALTPDGQRVIPSSVRADGTARREIRVRPGYSPPEDVEVYKNRGVVAWKARTDGGVPGAALADNDDGKKAGPSNKSARRRAAKLKAKEGNSHRAGKEQDEDGGKAKGKQQPDEPARAHPGPEPSKDDGEDPNVEHSKQDKEKQAKAIRKKIRQATDLKNRQDDGEKLLPEQVEKLTKLDKLIQQLDELGVEL